MLDMIDVQVDDIDGQVDDIVYKRLFNFYFIFPSMAGPISIIEVEIIGIYIVEYEDGDSDMWKKTFEQLPPSSFSASSRGRIWTALYTRL